jgi:sporulation protein YlmC with PRC-barrel domain
MRKQLLRITVLCTACLVMGAQAQSSTDPSSPSGANGSSGSSSGQSGYSGSQSGSSGSQSGWTGGRISPTGHMGNQELRASQLTGAQVTSSSGSEIATISDVIVNPGSGRIDFAVISLSSASGTGSTGGATSPSGTSSSSGTSAGSSSLGGSSAVGGSGLGSSSSAGKQVAVPWMLLRPSTSASNGAASGSTTQQPGFVFTGDTTKLESAPSFDATTDLSQPGWRQTILSYFGLSSRGSATGGSETPGGSSSSGSLQDSTSGSPK